MNPTENHALRKWSRLHSQCFSADEPTDHPPARPDSVTLSIFWNSVDRQIVNPIDRHGTNATAQHIRRTPQAWPHSPIRMELRSHWQNLSAAVHPSPISESWLGRPGFVFIAHLATVWRSAPGHVLAVGYAAYVSKRFTVGCFWADISFYFTTVGPYTLRSGTMRGLWNRPTEFSTYLVIIHTQNSSWWWKSSQCPFRCTALAHENTEPSIVFHDLSYLFSEYQSRRKGNYNLTAVNATYCSQ